MSASGSAFSGKVRGLRLEDRYALPAPSPQAKITAVSADGTLLAAACLIRPPGSP
jgi:hypothetical protein